MATWQAFVLGVMVAYTPSIVLLAFLLRSGRSAEENVNGLFGSEYQNRDPAKRRDPAEYQDEYNQFRPRGWFAPDFHQRFLPQMGRA